MLTRRLLIVAGAVFVLNSVFVGLYYRSDDRALAAEAVADRVDDIAAGLHGATLPPEAPARALFADHPEAYAFALVDRGGTVLQAMNADLIPAGATDLYADDWLTRIEGPGPPLLVAGHEFTGRGDGLRVVLVMRGDPAGLLWRAYLDEFYEHVWVPMVPLVLLLIGANLVLIRRGLAPVAAAASWARGLEPRAPTPPPATRLPAEIADLVDATERSVARLAQALEAETRRAAEAAHALRTPLAVLVARADALPPGEATERLRADLAAMSRTVRQVLAASRADAAPETAPLDLRGPVEAVVAALAPFAWEKGCDLSLGLAPDPVMARADAEGVEVAVTNLVENAILHGGAGPVEIAVGPGPEVSVRDHGPGLPEGAEERLFDPFWRGPGAVPGGAGLGLAIVARLQRAQGGSVAARNAPGGGTELVLRWTSPKI
jgi:two-component system OmpR family sensor kinase